MYGVDWYVLTKCFRHSFLLRTFLFFAGDLQPLSGLVKLTILNLVDCSKLTGASPSKTPATTPNFDGLEARNMLLS